MPKRKSLEMEPGSDNVFADLALADAEVRIMIAGDPIPTGPGIGFVFSTKEIDIYIHHNRRPRQASHAEYRNGDPKIYEADGYSLAA
jgi:hypothetical protein